MSENNSTFYGNKRMKIIFNTHNQQQYPCHKRNKYDIYFEHTYPVTILCN